MIVQTSFKNYSLSAFLCLTLLGCVTLTSTNAKKDTSYQSNQKKDSLICAKYACLFKNVSSDFWQRGTDETGDYYLLAEPIYCLDSLENYIDGKLPYFLSYPFTDKRYFLICTPHYGHERDAESGYDYRGTRFYDSEVARFLSEVLKHLYT